ncbi:MAG: YceI family protein [Hyphomonadaceae bacterium]|nr:YceI family protein [Hyphomonadaceae bacterium]
MRHTIIIAALLAAACATPAAPVQEAAPAPVAAAAPSIPFPDGASRDPAAAPAGAYNVDTGHTRVFWTVRHAGLGLFTARFDTVTGTLNFDPQNPANSSVNVTIPVASVSTGVVGRQGAGYFDREIANNVLGAAANPNITFVSRSIEVTGPTTGRITGDLTMKGQTHSVTLDATFEAGRFIEYVGKHKIGFTAHTLIQRSQWGAVFENPALDASPSQAVEIRIEAEFIQA